MGNGPSDGTSTPAGEPDDDFFSSWDKPAIKRPTPPASRTATPPVVGRTPSPFLNAGANTTGGNGIARSPSPLAGTDAAATPVSRAVHSSALRKTSSSGTGPRKANVLGAKKATKLGAKKIAGDVIDFDAAERKAKEEAERIEKLGYDPEAESAAKKTTVKSADTKVVSPTPVSARQGTYGNPTPRERSGSDAERLGAGMARLGFGQIGGAKPAAAATKKMGGFGSVGPIKAQEEGKLPPLDPPPQPPPPQPLSLRNATDNPPLDDSERYARQKFGAQKGISSDEFFNKGTFDPSAQSEAKTRLQGFEGASSISSNAYFGRDDEEIEDEYGDLESAAKDFVRKYAVTAGDDLDNLTQVLGEGAQRLQGAIRTYMNS